MTWQLVAIANAIVAVAYFSISWIIFSGLVRTGQLRKNRLGLATALIFMTCAVHHGAHALHMILPSLGVDDAKGLAMREVWDWHTVVWDFFTAAIGVYYLTLRGSYASVLRGAAMFEDLKARERQALEINDTIVQGLSVAKYSLDTGADDKTRAAIEHTLEQARTIISDLLGDEDNFGPGDLRRQEAAQVTKPS